MDGVRVLFENSIVCQCTFVCDFGCVVHRLHVPLWGCVVGVCRVVPAAMGATVNNARGCCDRVSCCGAGMDHGRVWKVAASGCFFPVRVGVGVVCFL